MKNLVAFALTVLLVIDLRAQDAASTPVPSPDVEELRQQVQALTETVKELKQQMKDQQAATGKANGSPPSSSPQNGGTPSVTSTSTEGQDGARPSNSPAPNA